MGAILRFVVGFILSLVGCIFVLDSINNTFISAFVISLIMAMLASRGD